MADNRKLSALPIADGLNNDDMILVTQAGLSKRSTVGEFSTGVLNNVVFQQEATEAEAVAGTTSDTVMTARRVKVALDAKTVNDDNWSGAALSVAHGGTGASTATAARTALGLAIGSDVQAYSATLASLSGASANGVSLATAANYTAMKTLLGLTVGTDVQAYDADLAALAANSTTGLWARTAAGTGAARTIAGTGSQIVVTNGDGVSGNPTLSLPASLTLPASASSAYLQLNAAALNDMGVLLKHAGTSRWQMGGVTPDGTELLFYSYGIGANAFAVGAADFRPGVDNNRKLGTASARWSEVFAGTGTINTSDARQKEAVRALTSAEIDAAKALASEIGAFRFLAAVAEKGDDARTHIGMTVQRAIEVMEGFGLDPMAYGFICYDEWDATPEMPASYTAPGENDDPETFVPELIRPAIPARAAGNAYGFRADQLLLFIARGFDARLSALEGV